MTTIIGIKASQNKEGVVLISDTRATRVIVGEDGIKQEVFEKQKIYVDEQKEFAIAFAGCFDQESADFISSILRRKIDLRKAIKKEYFEELNALNEKRWGWKVPNLSFCTSLLIASRFDNKPILYTCWPLGRIEGRYWTSIGSGSECALKYILNKDLLIPEYLSLDKAINLAMSALNESYKDMHTNGADLIVVTSNDICQYGDELRNRVKSAEETFMKEVISKYI